MSHIETSYKEILNNELNSQLLKEKEKIHSTVEGLLTNFTNLFLKDNTAVLKEICQLKVEILQLKTKLMIQHILTNNADFEFDDYRLAANLHNYLEEFSDEVGSIKWDQFESDREKYIELNPEYFDKVYSVLRGQYDALKEEFYIGDIWENWDYNADSEEEESDEYSGESFKPE
ncbi:hypothetical protein [Legionella resiliens]|uniref:Uncharacterized protein n=2 Tax=Legionellaceae TaxID=444 RepID=A0ABS8X073_9GAMM|nr:hypothetical protein [Legionella sp. 8cVS16]MCE3531032.1 hypothetical protein [Legionella sp. 8cVS16]